jgi:multicomponent Na+:H+ antiporter subunit E
VFHAASLSLILALLWMSLSWHVEPLMLAFGAASVVACVAIVRRMGILDGEAIPIHLTLRGLRYWPWLLWEIVKANIAVARVILHPRLPISPVLFTVKASQRTELGRSIFANSITLTPGTVAVGTYDDTITVHALTRDGAAGLIDDDTMDAKARWLEDGR